MSERAGQRIGAVLLALVFLFSSFALTGFVIWQIRQNNNSKKTSEVPAAVQDQLKQQQQQQQKQQQTKEGALQGTKLVDFTPVATVDSLQSIDTSVGTGDEVKPGDSITAHYTGAVAATGVIFQSSHDSGSPATFSLSGVIKGWTDGVPGMKVGGKRRLIIPAAQAYGASPPQGSGIPENAPLVFDIELVSIGAKQ